MKESEASMFECVLLDFLLRTVLFLSIKTAEFRTIILVFSFITFLLFSFLYFTCCFVSNSQAKNNKSHGCCFHHRIVIRIENYLHTFQ